VTVPNLRGAWWAWRAGSAVRRQLREGGLQAVALPPVPAGSARGQQGMEAALRRRSPTCLEGALVRQAWLSAQGDPQAVVIGVGRPGDAFGAHAWLESEAARESEGFVELMRHPATRAGHR
jgi:hypothetical protein